MQFQDLEKITLPLILRAATRNSHRRYIALSCLVLFVYAFTFLVVQFQTLIEGGSDFILNVGFIALALRQLYYQRQELLAFKALSDDRFLGYCVLLFGCLLLLFFRFFQTSTSLQALAAMLIVIGMAMSTWGLEFFQRFWTAIALMLVGMYPDLAYITVRVFRLFTSDDLLERIMAWAGSLSLNLFGFNAIAETVYVRLPEGAVEVAPGCSGFDMALSTVGIGFLMGQFMHASGKRTAGVMFAGWALAMIFNVPRIMLLSIAAVYWGQDSFDFWHGPIGGQIFSGILFTVYYYVAMWMIERPPQTLNNC